MFIQLNPPLPVDVVSQGGSRKWGGPTGSGMAILVKDLGPDYNNIWTVIMDETGEIWDIENPFVRGQRNLTWGRRVATTETT